MDLGPSSPADVSFLGPLMPEQPWVLPVPDARVVAEDGDPAQVAETRETIRLAFIAALQHLPARQRAVLILREVLRWPAAEVAELLDASVASINSALQRARATLAARAPSSAVPATAEATDRALLARYVDAFERYDISQLVALLREDAIQSMPPYAMWLRGRDRHRRMDARTRGAMPRVAPAGHGRQWRSCLRSVPGRSGGWAPALGTSGPGDLGRSGDADHQLPRRRPFPGLRSAHSPRRVGHLEGRLSRAADRVLAARAGLRRDVDAPGPHAGPSRDEGSGHVVRVVRPAG